jgi:peptidylprolyl isomerase
MMKNKCKVLLMMMLLVLISVTGCSSTAKTKDGDTVKVHYTGTLEDGSVFDTSVESEPLEFTLGQGEMIPGFEQAIIGMKVGESKTTKIPAEQAYGEYRDDLLIVIDRSQLPEDLEPKVGQQLQVTQTDGKTIIVPITDVSETTITVDANHFLAGKDLIFEIKLIEIK